MIPKLGREDFEIIGYNLGKIFNFLAILFSIPVVVALIYGEIDTIPYFLITSGVTLILGNVLIFYTCTKKPMELKHAICLVALTWVLASVLASTPLWLANATSSYLDANFESLSGFTGTGLTVAVDIDHMAHSVNFHRHLLQFVGDGIGIIVVSLTILGRTEISSVLAFRGEAREEGIRPSVVRTSRTIFGIAITFLLIGAIMFAIAGLHEGLDLRSSIFDGFCHSMTGYATGGFSTRSQNLLYYHGLWYELVGMVLAIIGALNFNLHYVVLRGKRREILDNIETRTFFFTLLLASTLISFCLLSSNVYSSTEAVFRKGVFQLVSAHTTTGFATVPSPQLALMWPALPIIIISIAMLVGGCANSTSGGVKALRVGILIKAFFLEVKRALLPRSAVVRGRFHHVEDSPLTDTVIKGAAMIATGYLLLFTLGTLITMGYGYDTEASMFETSSALCNVGLSSGITSPSMPTGLKITYMLLMWMGRLEVITVLVLLAALALGIWRGKEWREEKSS